MDSIGHFIWIVFTFPMWFVLSIIWIIGKFIILLLVSFYGVLFKGGFNSVEDLILFPIRLIYSTFENSNIVYEKFSEIYYDKSAILIPVIIFFMIIFYGAIGSSRR